MNNTFVKEYNNLSNTDVKSINWARSLDYFEKFPEFSGSQYTTLNKRSKGGLKIQRRKLRGSDQIKEEQHRVRIKHKKLICKDFKFKNAGELPIDNECIVIGDVADEKIEGSHPMSIMNQDFLVYPNKNDDEALQMFLGGAVEDNENLVVKI
ncbi:hypothetical protein RFI_33005 [Reticulomyxa filosa]|uniref:Uncharacterized protein n=1 Tax=Reticulomyxa filosa TaxID=46433 RepID=X6LTH9_RETFI|nr:hypothetical protein RFI_33005 [Reticulomyxa filosa]|eukprot:ETO04392.1 hypothetical protein RFI_33005 [Reticulomyxa filosa]